MGFTASGPQHRHKLQEGPLHLIPDPQNPERFSFPAAVDAGPYLDPERGARAGHDHDHSREAGAAATEPTGEHLPGAGAGERRGAGSGREDGDATGLEGENLDRARPFVETV